MAKFHRHKNNIIWLEITWLQLVSYSGNGYPICDNCLKCLIGRKDIVLIPMINEAFCPTCGQDRLGNLKRYPEDRLIEEKREEFWLDYFGIKRDRPVAPGAASTKSIYSQSTNLKTGCQDVEGLS